MGRAYVWKAPVGEGPGESPAAGVALDELCECVIRYLCVNGAICEFQLRGSREAESVPAGAYRVGAEERHERCQR